MTADNELEGTWKEVILISFKALSQCCPEGLRVSGKTHSIVCVHIQILTENFLNTYQKSYVYWTVYRCNSWRIKDQLDVTLLFYFTSYVLNMFRTLIYPSSGACDCAVELPRQPFCSRSVVCWRFGAAGFAWCPCCRLQPATRTRIY